MPPFATTAYAQAYNGAIVGNVTDSSGAVIPNVKITAINSGTNANYTATTSGAGSYSIPQLPIGVYVVHAEAAAFKEAVISNVEVHVSTNAEVNVVMQVGALSEKVVVQADTVKVQTTSAVVGEVISGTQVRELPLDDAGGIGIFLEVPIAIIAIKQIVFVRKIGDRDRRPAGVIVVPQGYVHRGLLGPVVADCCSRLKADLLEFPVAQDH